MYYDRYSRNSRWNEEGGMKVQGSPGLSFFEKRSAKEEKKKGFFFQKEAIPTRRPRVRDVGRKKRMRYQRNKSNK